MQISIIIIIMFFSGQASIWVFTNLGLEVNANIFIWKFLVESYFHQHLVSTLYFR